MDTEPPEGDDLQRMLVPMKRHVLEHAAPRRSRRGRNTGIALGVVGVLLLGAAGGGVALGLIPTSLTAERPTPTSPPAPEPTTTETPSGAPVVGRPTPVPTPTPTSTRPVYALSDPSTWTISGSEVGPIAFGGDRTAELDDLAATFRTLGPDEVCPDPNVVYLERQGLQLIVAGLDGTVQSIQLSADYEDPDAPAPTTAEGLGLGSTLAELRATYPDLHWSEEGKDGPSDTSLGGGWVTSLGGATVTFLTTDQDVVWGMWVSTRTPEPPYEYC